jgi:hypothetical protein
MDLVTMSKEELSRLEIMERLEERRMIQRTAAEILGVSVRQVKRLLRAYRCEGAAEPLSYWAGAGQRYSISFSLLFICCKLNPPASNPSGFISKSR